jgi:hypothetical protein
MIDNLLESRRGSGFPSNRGGYDEDVNVYLASLLTSSAVESAGSVSSRVLSYDLDLFESVGAGAAPRERFEAYKANADDLLLRLAVFDNPSGRRPGSVRHMAMTREAWIGRCKSYYRMAWACAAGTFRRPTAIGDIMGKLADGLEKYIDVISAMRASSLNILPSLSDGQIYHLGRTLSEEERTERLPLLYDRFLDAWSDYRETGGEREKRILESVSGELREADPSFEFDPLAGGQSPLMKSPQ